MNTAKFWAAWFLVVWLLLPAGAALGDIKNFRDTSLICLRAGRSSPSGRLGTITTRTTWSFCARRTKDMELTLQTDYKPGEAAKLAQALAQIYGGRTIASAVGDGGYKIQMAGRDDWFAFASLGPDILMSISGNKPEDAAVREILRSLKPAEMPASYMERQKKKAASKKESFSSWEAGLIHPPAGLDNAKQIELMKTCLTGAPADITALIEAGANPRWGLADLAWPAVLGLDKKGWPDWRTPLVEPGAIVDLARQQYRAPFTTAGTAAAWNPNPEVLKTVLALLPPDDELSDSKNSRQPPLATLLDRPHPRPEALKLLLESGADLNGLGRSLVGGVHHVGPLVIAARNSNDPEIIKILLAAGADPNERFFESRAGGGENPGVSAIAASVLRRGTFLGPNDSPWAPEITDALAEGGARVTTGDLFLAAGFGGEGRSLEYILELWRKQNPEADLQPVLNELLPAAIKHDRLDCLEVLVKAGLDLAAAARADQDLAVNLLSGRYLRYEKTAERLAALNLNPNIVSSKGETPLTQAIQNIKGFLELPAGIPFLIEAGADVNKPNAAGRTPLMLAVSAPRGSSYADLVELLLANGADPGLKGPGGLTALMYAAAGPYQDMVDRLLAAGADVNQLDDFGCDALIYAIVPPQGARRNDHAPARLEALISLMRAGADPNRLTADGWPPLAYAALTNPEPEVIRALAAAGADPKFIGADGKTTLDLAVALNPNPLVAKELMKHGASMNQAYNPPATAVYLADLLDCRPEVEYDADSDGDLWALLTMKRKDRLVWSGLIGRAIEHGADLTETDQAGRTPLVYAAQQLPDQMALAAIRQLLRKGADPNARDAYGLTPLMQAARFQKYGYFYGEIVSTFIEYGADLEARDANGHTAFMQTAVFERSGDEAIAKMEALQKLGADVHTRDDRGGTVLLNVYLLNNAFDDYAIINWLLARGIDPALTEADGLNAALASALAKWGAKIDSLYAAGCDPLAVDNQGRNALMHLFRQRYPGRGDAWTIKKVTRDGRIDLNSRDAHGLTVLCHALFSQAAPSSLSWIAEEGGKF